MIGLRLGLRVVKLNVFLSLYSLLRRKSPQNTVSIAEVNIKYFRRAQRGIFRMKNGIFILCHIITCAIDPITHAWLCLSCPCMHTVTCTIHVHNIPGAYTCRLYMQIDDDIVSQSRANILSTKLKSLKEASQAPLE